MNFHPQENDIKEMEVKEYKDEYTVEVLIYSYKYRCIRTKKIVSNVIEIKTVK